jgi:hypothetical protein
MIIAEMRNYTNRKVIQACNHAQGSALGEQLFALCMLTANVEHMSMRIDSLTPKYAPSPLIFRGRRHVIAQLMKLPMVQAFRKWKAALSEDGDEDGDEKGMKNVENIYVKKEKMEEWMEAALIKQLETALHSIHLKQDKLQEWMEAALMDIKDSFQVLMKTQELKGSPQKLQAKSQISTDTFETKERAEETELRNQKQTSVLELQGHQQAADRLLEEERARQEAELSSQKQAFVQLNFNRGTAGGLPRGRFLTPSTEHQQTADTTRRLYVEKSRMSMMRSFAGSNSKDLGDEHTKSLPMMLKYTHAGIVVDQKSISTGSAETFVVCPIANERAEEAEMRNQKQTYVLELQGHQQAADRLLEEERARQEAELSSQNQAFEQQQLPRGRFLTTSTEYHQTGSSLREQADVVMIQRDSSRASLLQAERVASSSVNVTTMSQHSVQSALFLLARQW